MPRKETSAKIGPKSGRINPTAVLRPQSTAQMYRVYNTGEANCSAHGLVISQGCSADFGVSANTNVALGGSGVEAIYESLPSAGLRSGQFRKPEANQTIIQQLGRGTIYRFFNTRKGNQTINVTVDTEPHAIASKCSKDIYLAGNAVVKVGTHDEGVYEFLSLYIAQESPENSVRSGHFMGKASGSAAIEIKIARVGDGAPAVYRLFNSGSGNLTYSSGPMPAQSLARDTSCDVEVPPDKTLIIGAGPGVTEVEGSYELLRIN